MQQVDEYTEGWTAAIEYDLSHDHRTFDASGMTPSLVLKDKDGNVVQVQGIIDWANAAESRIRFNPAATDLVVSKAPYTLHWKVTDAAEKVAFYPQGTPILVRVFPQ